MSCLRYPAAAQEARIEHLVVLNVHFVRDERDLHLNSQQRKVYFRQTFQHDGEGQKTGSNKMSIMAHPSVLEFSTFCNELVCKEIQGACKTVQTQCNESSSLLLSVGQSRL